MAGGEDRRGFDPRRREFFRTFGRQTVRSAGAVVAAADELRRAGGEAARELMDLGSPVEQVRTADLPAREMAPTTRRPAESFRSAYRATDDGLILLDQRELPARVAMVTVREPSEIASAIRLGVMNAGPVLGEVVAYGLALAAADAEASGWEADSVARSVAAAAGTLRESRHDVRAIGHALDRMAAHFGELISQGEAGPDLGRGLRAEADRIASEGALAHSALGRALGDRLRSTQASLTLLVHSDCGPLSFGLVGPLTAALQSLRAQDVPLHVFVTEAAPGLEGTRLVAPQLAQIDVPHTVIADSAVAWLLSARQVDAAVIRADYVCANGDLAAVVGSLNVAMLAQGARVQVIAIGPPSAHDPQMPDGTTLAKELRWPAADTEPAPGAATLRLDPGTDIVPAALVHTLV